MLKREEIKEKLSRWNKGWDDHDLDAVMDLFHEDVIFENWTGALAKGKEALRKAWEPWFKNHGGFHFSEEDTFIDESAQKALYRWRLDWQSAEKGWEGKPEARRGVDVIHFEGGKIIRKYTYCKTTVEIGGNKVRLAAQKSSC